MSVIIRLQNLPWSANSLDIRNFFAGLSIPEGGVHIVGGEMGDAFIAFSTDEDARRAMMMTGRKLKEVQISLMLSSRTEMLQVIEAARSMSMQASKATTVAAATPATPVPTAIQPSADIPGFGGDFTAARSLDFNAPQVYQERSRDNKERSNQAININSKESFKDLWEKGTGVAFAASGAAVTLPTGSSVPDKKSSHRSRSKSRSRSRSRSHSRDRTRNSRRKSYDRDRDRDRNRGRSKERSRDRNRDRQSDTKRDSKKTSRGSDRNKDYKQDLPPSKPLIRSATVIETANTSAAAAAALLNSLAAPAALQPQQPQQQFNSQIWLPPQPPNPLQQIATMQSATQLLAALPVNLVDQLAAHLTGRHQAVAAAAAAFPTLVKPRVDEDDRRPPPNLDVDRRIPALTSVIIKDNGFPARNTNNTRPSPPPASSTSTPASGEKYVKFQFGAEVIGAPDSVTQSDIRRAFAQNGIVVRDVMIHDGRVIVGFLNSETKKRCLRQSEKIQLGDHKLNVFHLSPIELNKFEEKMVAGRRGGLPLLDDQRRRQFSDANWFDKDNMNMNDVRFTEKVSRSNGPQIISHSRFKDRPSRFEDNRDREKDRDRNRDRGDRDRERKSRSNEKERDGRDKKRGIKNQEVIVIDAENSPCTDGSNDVKLFENDKVTEDSVQERKDTEVKDMEVDDIPIKSMKPDDFKDENSVSHVHENVKAFDEKKQMNNHEEDAPECILLKCLPKDSTDRDICDFFSDIGIYPSKIHVMVGVNGRSTGDAFVEFLQKEHLRLALTKDGAPFGLNTIVVIGASNNDLKNALEGKPVSLPHRPSKPDFVEHFPPSHPSQHHPPPITMGPPPMMGGGPPPRFPPPLPHPQMMMNGPSEPPPELVINMHNIPFRAGTEEIIEFFRPQFNIPPNMIFRRRNERGHNTGDARVVMPSYQDAVRAVKLFNRKYILDRPVYLQILAQSTPYQ